MKYLHLFASDKNEKFSLPFIEFMNKFFDASEHYFLVFGSNSINLFNYKNVRKLNKNLSSLILAVKQISKSEKIIIHGLFSWLVLVLLILNPKYIKKSNWIIWGGDLYHYQYREKSIRSNVKEIVRRYIIKNLGALITQVRGDYKLAQSWYGATGKYYYSFVYPSNLYKDYDLEEIYKDHDEIVIQVGNSACNTNNHIEVFEKLAKYKEKNIVIVCPLSYSGKQNYINNVIDKGRSIFEEKFIPIIDFMPLNEYLTVLAKVDVAIFNHNRQRGLGNIITLLGLGKKVYIRKETTTWDFCLEHDLKVFNGNEDFEDLFEGLNINEKNKNINNVKMKFSEEKLKADLREIFPI